MTDIFNALNNNQDAEPRVILAELLKDQLPHLEGGTKEGAKAAYEIAGLMSTDFAQSISTSEPLDEILTIAGELEIHPDNAEELRLELIEKIQAL